MGQNYCCCQDRDGQKQGKQFKQEIDEQIIPTGKKPELEVSESASKTTDDHYMRMNQSYTQGSRKQNSGINRSSKRGGSNRKCPRQSSQIGNEVFGFQRNGTILARGVSQRAEARVIESEQQLILDVSAYESTALSQRRITADFEIPKIDFSDLSKLPSVPARISQRLDSKRSGRSNSTKSKRSRRSQVKYD